MSIVTDDYPEATAEDLAHLGLTPEPTKQPLMNQRERKAKAKPVPKFDPQLGVFVDEKTGEPIPRNRRVRPPRILPHQLKIDMRSVFDKAQDMIIDKDRVVTRDSDGFHLGNAGKKLRTIQPRKMYRRGTHWRVVGRNVRVEAMCTFGQNAQGHTIWSGWSRVIPEGTILECIGWRRFREDGLVAPQFHFDGLPREAQWSQVWPLESVFQPWPLQGILEKIMPSEYESLGIRP